MPILGNQNEVGVRISTKADNKGIDEAEGRIKSFAKTAQTGSLAVVGGFTAIAGAAAAAGLGTIKMAADMEQSEIAFTTLLGNADKAKSFLNDLFQFAAETPFEFNGLQDAGRKLLAFGFEANQIIPMMTNIGDAVAALGGGQFEIDRVTRALGQMQAKGKVSAEEMMQLAELGIPVWELLAEKIGTDIPTAMKMAEKGTISGADGINAILAGMNKRFGGAMEGQSETINGLWSTLKDNVAQQAIVIGKELINAFNIKEALKSVIPMIKSFGDTLKNTVIPFLKENVPLIKAAAVALGVTLVGAITAATVAFVILNSQAILITGVIVAIGAAVGALYYAWETNFLGIRDIVQGMVDYFTNTLVPALQSVWDWIGESLTWLKDNWAEAIGYVIGFVASLPVKLGYLWGTALMSMINQVRNINWGNVWNVIVTSFTTAWNGLYDIAMALYERIKAIKWGELFTNAGKGILNSVLGLLEGAIQGALSGVPGVSKIKLPRYANGGTNVPGGLALVGERGPELVRLPRGADVIPNHKIGGMTVQQTNNIYNQVDIDAAMRDLAWALRR